MDGSCLRFYLTQGHRLHGVPLWEWLLRTSGAAQPSMPWRALAATT
jgi:hypothetical protein